MYNRQLDAFIAAAELGSFSRAAGELFITPAALIQQVNLLEKRLNVDLFRRSNQGVALTAAGRSLYEDAIDLRQRAMSAVEKARGLQNADTRTVRVGTSLHMKCRLLPDLWLRVMERLPSLRIEIVSLQTLYASRHFAIDELDKTYDVQEGLYLSESYAGRCGFVPLSQERLLPAVSDRHPLASRERISLEDLEGQTVVVLKPGLSAHYDRLHEELAREARCTIESVGFYDMDVFTTCELEGKVLFTPAAWQDIHPSLHVHDCELCHSIPYGLIHGQDPKPAVSLFIEAVSACLSTCLGEELPLEASR